MANTPKVPYFLKSLCGKKDSEREYVAKFSKDDQDKARHINNEFIGALIGITATVSAMAFIMSKLA